MTNARYRRKQLARRDGSLVPLPGRVPAPDAPAPAPAPTPPPDAPRGRDPD